MPNWAGNRRPPDGPGKCLAPSAAQSRAKSFVVSAAASVGSGRSLHIDFVKYPATLALFKGCRGAGVSACQWHASCEPTEPAGETRAPAVLPLTLGRRSKRKERGRIQVGPPELERSTLSAAHEPQPAARFRKSGKRCFPDFRNLAAGCGLLGGAIGCLCRTQTMGVEVLPLFGICGAAQGQGQGRGTLSHTLPEKLLERSFSGLFKNFSLARPQALLLEFQIPSCKSLSPVV